MKRIVSSISLMAAALLISAMPTLGDEGVAGTTGQQMQQPAQKDECLLVAKNCGNQVDSIQQRIDRLQKEIGRGTDVYSNEELNNLKEKLDDANKTLDYMENGGA